MKSLSLRNSCQLFSHHPCRAREEWQPGWQRQERNWNTDPGQCCSSHWIYMYYPHIKGAVTFFLTKNISYSFLKPCSYFIPHRQKSLKLADATRSTTFPPETAQSRSIIFPRRKKDALRGEICSTAHSSHLQPGISFIFPSSGYPEIFRCFL